MSLTNDRDPGGDSSGEEWDDIEDELLLSIDVSGNETSSDMVQQHGRAISGLVPNDASTSTTATGCAKSPRKPLEGTPNDGIVPLDRFKRGYLWVSDLTAQCWCEQQMVYGFTLPDMLVENPVMTAGTSIHLAREVEVQDIVNVKITSYEDIFAIKVMNLLGAVDSFLSGTPIRREIPIFGVPYRHNVFVMGLIDEIRCDFELFTFDIVEFKTRRFNSLPSKAQKEAHMLQVMLYKKLFDDLVLGRTNKAVLQKHLKLRLGQELGSEVMTQIRMHGLDSKNLDGLLDSLFSKMQCMPCISQQFVEYCHQEDSSTIGIESVLYDDEWLQMKLDHYVAYWKGHRDPCGVEIEEAWKCQRCDFAEVCEWRQEKSDECQRKNSSKGETVGK